MRLYSAATGTEGANGRVALRVDALLDDVAEMADETLHRPGGGVAQRADGVALDLVAHLEQHIDLALLGLPFAMRSSTRHIQPVPSRQGVHWPQDSCL